MDTLQLDAPYTAPPNSTLIHDHAERAYLEYALAVVKGRALPRVEDGQKPVQLRILYAMMKLGLSTATKPVKSAKVVGDVMANYHPHGDSSIYEAMVRQAQGFTLRYPLVDGQGNFGTLDGDSAAAMRYTEAKLMPVSDLLLSELNLGTVDWKKNYDGESEEPTVLPARLPFLLLNGASGIAVGVATEIPPHNLREVAGAAAHVIENPDATFEDVMTFITAPDFPGGGQIISTPEQIAHSYRNGNTSLHCRARWIKEDQARNQWQIVITELPYQVSTKDILEEIEELTNPKIKTGKKALSQEQLNLKQLSLDFLEKARDESDKDNLVRIVLVPRTSKIDSEQMMAFLLANTSLQTSVQYNLTMIGLDGRPQQKGLLAILEEWAAFRVTTVRRRTTHLLDVALRRIHILEGRRLVLLSIDEVIRIIRESDEAKSALMKAFGLSELQADDILEIRLRQLARLEAIKIDKELAELRSEETYLRGLLESESSMRALIVSEIRADAAKYGDDRRTIVQAAERITTTTAAALSVPDEDVTVVISKSHWVKAYRGRGLAADAFSFKLNDSAAFVIETRTTLSFYMLDDKGRAYEIDASSVPIGRGDGVPLSTLLDLQDGAKVLSALSGADDDMCLFFRESGFGYISELKNLKSRNKAGKAFQKTVPGDRIMAPLQVPKRDAEGKVLGWLACGSSDGRMVIFTTDEVNVYPGGLGVKLISLEDGAKLAAVTHAAVDHLKINVSIAGKSHPVTIAGEDWARHLGRRANKGAFLPKKGILIA